MTHKRPFLLATARRLVCAENVPALYDEHEQVNVSFVGGRPYPLVLDASAAWTSSKTEAAPGDDDPDPEAEGCY